jgi:hypothetical protein
VKDHVDSAGAGFEPEVNGGMEWRAGVRGEGGGEEGEGGGVWGRRSC